MEHVAPEDSFEQLFQLDAGCGTVYIEHTFGHRGLRGHGDWRVIMTATLANTVNGTARTTLRPGAGTTRVRGAVPMARPEASGPSLNRPSVHQTTRPAVAASACRVLSPQARRAGIILRVKVATIGLVALVGLGASVAEVSSWSHPDPSVDYVAGDPAWAHVTSR